MTDKNNSYTKEISTLYSVISNLAGEDECRIFFEDLCTRTELHALAQRFDVAQRLHDGQSFSLISAETGASTATISRVSHCLSCGSGGYNAVLKKLK